MKTVTGYWELIIIMVFMMAATPLILIVMRQINLSHFEYLDDKSTIAMTDDYRMYEGHDGKIYTEGVNAIYLDIGEALCIPLVNDDYCPNEGREIDYLYSVTHTECNHVTDCPETEHSACNHFCKAKLNYTREDLAYMLNRAGVSEDSIKVQIIDGWSSYKYNTTSTLANTVATNGIIEKYSNTNDAKYMLKMYYNGELDNWFITDMDFNIYTEGY